MPIWAIAYAYFLQFDYTSIYNSLTANNIYVFNYF